MPEEPTYPNDWARLVGELMRRQGWTRTEMAARAGVNRNTIRRWLSGETANATTTSVRLVADAAGIDYAVASRAVLGAQLRRANDDDEAIRDVLASDFPEQTKTEIVEYIRKRRAEYEDGLRRDIEMLLRSRAAS